MVLSTTHDHLIAYGLHLLHQVTGVQPAGPSEPQDVAWAQPFERLLGTAWPEPDPAAPLTSIFSRVHLPEKDQEDPRPAPTTYLRPAPLEMQANTLFPHSEPPDDLAAAKQDVGRGFERDYASLRRTLPADDPRFFTAFYHLMERFGWALPNTYGEPGVNLFQQWKGVAALAFASGGVEGGPAGGFTLVGGDIPGIQRMIYTITSKGAAKGLRGRSLFIQFLGDAVVRRLVHELDLSPANVIYAAGGNFTLLAPQGEHIQTVLDRVNQDINRTLLDTYDGDIALCLASVPIPAQAVGTAEFGDRYSLELKRAIGQQKARRFAEIANGAEGWTHVFEPQGGGGERAHFCAVCQAELSAEELQNPELLLVDVAELEPGETAPRACYDCATFRELAETVGRPHRALMLHHAGKPGGDRWQGLLYRLSDGWCYRFTGWDQSTQPGESKYVLNRTDFVDLGAHAFLFLANTTPRVTPGDVTWWGETYPDQQDKIKAGDIRNFELLAHAAEVDGALERVGVLRMDVDDLGRVMTRGLVYQGQPNRSMAATSALSAALDRFFTGYLDLLCQQVTEAPNMSGVHGHGDEELLYVIYAGGDDLFVVGSWHLLPLLAERVRQAFEHYTGANPFLHISAGITLEGRKFPLYQAATRAGEALDGGAKKHEYVERVSGQDLRLKKNAVHFLGQTVGWDDFAQVRERVDALVELIDGKNLPRGLLHTLRRIYNRFREDQKEARRRGLSDERARYGPWMWRQAYTLKRLAQRHREAAQDISTLQNWLLQHTDRLGLAARWADYLTRVKEG